MTKWLTHLAILIGLKKFDAFAAAHPQLPNDALAVANTLDSYPAKGAATLIVAVLGTAAENVLKGAETVEQALTHLIIILGGVCILWVRHAISKHDVQINAALQKARDAAGIKAG